jgi:hypothetical protein
MVLTYCTGLFQRGPGQSISTVYAVFERLAPRLLQRATQAAGFVLEYVNARSGTSELDVLVHLLFRETDLPPVRPPVGKFHVLFQRVISHQRLMFTARPWTTTKLAV